MSIRSLKDRLKRLTPPVIGEDVERDLRRRFELRSRSRVPGLTPAEKDEYAKLNASLKKVDAEGRRLFSLNMKDFRATHCDGDPLTEAERIELVELSKRHRPNGLLEAAKALELVRAGKDLSILRPSQ
jgi:hypothetical protein